MIEVHPSYLKVRRGVKIDLVPFRRITMVTLDRPTCIYIAVEGGCQTAANFETAEEATDALLKIEGILSRP